MTKQKIREVSVIYKNKIADLYNLSCVPYGDKMRKLIHCYSMLQRMDKLLQENKQEKCFRWLGFIQGVFWSEYIFSVEDLKKHNMPDGEEFDRMH